MRRWTNGLGHCSCPANPQAHWVGVPKGCQGVHEAEIETGPPPLDVEYLDVDGIAVARISTPTSRLTLPLEDAAILLTEALIAITRHVKEVLET